MKAGSARLAGYISALMFWIGLGTMTHLSAEEHNISIATQVDTLIATIGDHINYTVRLSYPVGTTFQLPQIDQLEQFELIEQKLGEPKRRGDLITQEWRLTLTVFDTGKITIPAMEILAHKAGDSTSVMRFTTTPQTITVYSVLAPDSRELKDIKPPFRLPTAIPWRWLLFFAILIAAIGSSWWYYRDWQRRHPKVELNEAYLEPPHVIALRNLQALLTEAATAEELRSLFFKLSEIIRYYLERRYFIRALEMATSEICQVLPEIDLAQEHRKNLIELLENLDFVKYTGANPDRDYLARCTQQARQLVEATKRESFLRRTM